MNASATMGPVQVAVVTYLICTVISLGVAGMIKLLFGIIKLQRNSTVPVAVEISAKPGTSR
ncbi:MAG: hypothetical protein HY881_00135 [Deltaproteobacteria bacterium]|nr:hypothetical protein [Deltaproteobacteria bacterium]